MSVVSHLMAGVTRVELGQDGSWNTFEHLLGEDTEELPTNVEGLEHCTVLVVTLWKNLILF